MIERNTKVRLFSQSMMLQFEKNSHKDNNQDLSWEPDALHKRLLEEAEELIAAINNDSAPSVILTEAADVANFAFMIAESQGVFKKDD